MGKCMCAISCGFFGFIFLTEAVFSLIRVIRELATKALHNLTIWAPECMAYTGENSSVFLLIYTKLNTSPSPSTQKDQVKFECTIFIADLLGHLKVLVHIPSNMSSVML